MRLKKGNENIHSMNRPTKNLTRPSTNLLSRIAFSQPSALRICNGREGNKGYEEGGLGR